MRFGLSMVNLPGRFQVIPGPPRQVFDVAHNTQAVQSLAKNVVEMAISGKTYVLFGALSDKPIVQLLQPFLPLAAGWLLTDLPEQRASCAEDVRQHLLAEAVEDNDITCFSSVALAYQSALELLGEEDCLIVYGSFHTVAGVIEQI